MKFRINVNSAALLLRCLVAGLGVAAVAGAVGAVAGKPPAAPPARMKPVVLVADFADWQKLNAQALEEYARPIRSATQTDNEWYYIGGPGGRRLQFKYAPVFKFDRVAGAKSYRFTVTRWDKDRKNRLDEQPWTFEAADPCAPLGPIWARLPLSKQAGKSETWFRLTVEGLDEEGCKPVGVAKTYGKEHRDFKKEAPFQGPIGKPKVGLRQAALDGARVWEQDCYHCYVGFSGGAPAMQAHWQIFEATGNQLYLAKALTIAYALSDAFVRRDGYGWAHFSGPRAGVPMLEFSAFLKKHGLSGAE